MQVQSPSGPLAVNVAFTGSRRHSALFDGVLQAPVGRYGFAVRSAVSCRAAVHEGRLGQVSLSRERPLGLTYPREMNPALTAEGATCQSPTFFLTVSVLDGCCSAYPVMKLPSGAKARCSWLAMYGLKSLRENCESPRSRRSISRVGTSEPRAQPPRAHWFGRR